jgi:hypothetical protein
MTEVAIWGVYRLFAGQNATLPLSALLSVFTKSIDRNEWCALSVNTCWILFERDEEDDLYQMPVGRLMLESTHRRAACSSHQVVLGVLGW